MTLLRQKIITLLTISYALVGHGQYQIKGKIVDAAHGELLSNVIITNLNSKNEIVSGVDGSFEIINKGPYSFKKLGYLEKVINIQNENYLIVQLSLDPSELNEIIVNASQLPRTLKTSFTTTNVLSKKDIDRGNNIDIAPILNRAPGVFMQSGALNTNRITIRGIGARNLFGTAKIRAYFKDIPLTSGSGETTIEDFELASISRFEITKGASSIYGAGLGGTIQITPQNAYFNQNIANSEFIVGSYGLTKGIISMNHGTAKNTFNAVLSSTHSDGYRDNNEYDRQTVTLSSSHYLGKTDELSILLSYVDLKAFIPSSLSEDNFLNNPTSAAFTWGQSKGFEDSQRGILGISWNHEYYNTLKQVTSVFTSFRTGYEPRPFNVLDENTFALGIRTRLLGRSKFMDKELNWTLGGELFRDQYKSKTFENLYRDFPEGHGSVQGGPLSNFKEKRNYFNLFFETHYELTKKTTISAGLNFNHTSYDLDDRFPASVNNPDQSGTFKFDGILSPRFGISHQLNPAVSLYSNISHGFSPITLEETLLPDGQINTDLKPETGWNYELGTRGTMLKNKLQFNLAVYRLAIKNLLVARRTSQDQFIGINAGETQHDGLELDLQYNWICNSNITLSSFVNYTLNDYEFKEFIDDTDNFSGNDLTGVPSEVFNTGIDFSSKFGLYGNLNFQYVGSMPITDSNSLYSDDYRLANTKFGYRFEPIENFNLNLYYGLNNIFDEQYASQILINTSGFGGSAPRYYYPGNPRNHYGGINMSYEF